MSDWKIPLYRIATDNKDIRNVTNVLQRNTDWAIGPEINQFEGKLSDFVGTKYCVVFNSGTSALHASLLSIGIRPRDQVMVPTFTFISTVNSILMVNATPYFVDIENETLGLDPTKVLSSISDKVKTIIPVHYAGLSCKIDELQEIARRKKISLIEDVAESLGSTKNGKNVGTFGDLSVLSFAPNKIITTGEGGAVLTDSKKLFEKLKLVRSHGRLEKTNYFSSISKPDYVDLGYNWRMSSMSAALGLSQLSRIRKLIKMRQKNAHFLSSRLGKIPEISVPNEPSDSYHVFQLYSIRLPNSKIRNNLMKFLSGKGIMTKIYFDPVHTTKYYSKIVSKKTDLSNSIRISEQILSLPMFPTLTAKELEYIVNSITKFFN